MGRAPSSHRSGTSCSPACSTSLTSCDVPSWRRLPPSRDGATWRRSSSGHTFARKTARSTPTGRASLQVECALRDPALGATGPLLERQHGGIVGALDGLHSCGSISGFQNLHNAALDQMLTSHARQRRALAISEGRRWIGHRGCVTGRACNQKRRQKTDQREFHAAHARIRRGRLRDGCVEIRLRTPW